MNYEMIKAAQSRLAGHARVTPLLSSPMLNDMAGRQIFVKAECLQHTGSFKYRGAYSAISALSDQDRTKGILAFSSGNHAQGIALAAKEHGINAVIIMPQDAPVIKINNTKSYGAEVVLYDRATQDRDAIGDQISQERGLNLIKPFDDPQVIAGQGTTGLEIASQAGEHSVTNASVLVCCGGGGLTSGIATALAQDAPDFTVHPVEPDGFDDVKRYLASGQHERNSALSGGICDAIITPTPGKLTLPLMLEHCPFGISVTETQVLRAMALAYERLKIVVEPGGAVALAAALFDQNAPLEDTVIAVASGGNVDPHIFAKALSTL